MRRKLHTLLAGLAALALLAGGCTHYRESVQYWQAPKHEKVREIYEIPLALLAAPFTIFAFALYPFEQDKERPSFVEAAAITTLLADPTRNVDQE